MQAIKNYRACLWLSGCLILRSFCCFAHDEPVHEKLSESAAKLSSGLTGFLTDQFGNSDAPFVENPRLYFWPADIEPAVGVAGPIGWIKVGSRTEDAPYRYKNHFHDPTKNPPIGLTDGWIFGAFPSFEWASVPGIGDLLNVNNDTWPNARNLEWEALTTSNKGSREASLGHMFYALGRIIHLNQDLSQPDHVRNDNHMQIGGGIRPFGPHWIENHGKWNYMRHPEWFVLDPAKHIQGWSAWRQGGFTKLEAFWDRNKYTGTDEQLIAALDHDVDPDKKLGLAEFCNGNFLGEDATYAEYFTPGDQHYFPFPRVRRMQSFKDYQGNLPANVRMTFVRNGDSVYRIPIKKDKDGPTVNAHSMLLYLGTMPQFDAYTRPVAYVSSTINESAVLDEYHSILLPKAVEYSAGILDYFFRGKLEVSTVTLNANCGYDLAIKNLSGQDFRGGEFRLYWDDQSGNRTRLLDPGSPTAGSFSLAWSQSSTLGDNQTVVAIFKPPTGVTVAKYTLVYRGIIGSDGSGAPVDPVERESMGNDLAIATQSFGPVCMPLCLGLTWTFSDSTVQSITVDVPAGCSAAEIHIHLGGVWGECPLPSGSYAGASVEVDNEVLWYHDGMDDLTFNLTVPFSLSAGSHTLILAASHGLPVSCGTPTVSGTVIWR